MTPRCCQRASPRLRILQELKEHNQRFASETFKPIGEGGTWLPEAIAECARLLAAADASVDAAEGRNFDRVSEARKKGEQDLAEAHESFTEMVGRDWKL